MLALKVRFVMMGMRSKFIRSMFVVPFQSGFSRVKYAVVSIRVALMNPVMRTKGAWKIPKSP